MLSNTFALPGITALALVLVVQKISFSRGNGSVKLKLVSYFDSTREGPSGKCCNGSPLNGACTDSCNNVLYFCLRNESTPGEKKSDCLSDFTTSKFPTSRPDGAKGDWAVQKHKFGGENLNKNLPFTGALAVDTMTIHIEARNSRSDETSEVLATFDTRRGYLKKENKTVLGLTYPQSSSYADRWIVLEWQVICNENYYQNCVVYCKPTDDDSNGHYTCDHEGQKQCITGYREPETNCVKAVDYCLSSPCKSGGLCNATYSCQCPPDFPCQSVACQENPCEYSAECHLRPGFECLCTSSYEGSQCEKEKPLLSGGEIAGVVVGLVVAIVGILIAKKCHYNLRKSSYDRI